MSKPEDEGAKAVSRRTALKGASALAGAAALGSACSNEDGDAGGAGGTGGGSGDGGPAGGAAGASNDGAPIGLACDEPNAASAEDLLAGIDTIVVLMMENRSFDHYFGSLALVEGRAVNGLTGSESNLDSSGAKVELAKLEAWRTLFDPPHGWDASHAQFAGGAMTGFVTEYELDGAPAADLHHIMGYYVREQLPVLYALADEYALCDAWFASVMGPTWPNRFYLHCATSGGVTRNIAAPGLRSVFDLLDDGGISNRYYYSNLPVTFTYAAMGVTPRATPIAQFFTDAAESNLPDFSIVDPAFAVGATIGSDDHPPADIRDGQAFIATVYQALAKSPQWEKTLFVITYDEHGGYYDHVPPPMTDDDLPEFRQVGFRVPSLVIGPSVRRGCVVSTQFEHASIAATLSKKYGLPALTARAAAANDLSSALDEKLLERPRAPIELPMVDLGGRSSVRARESDGQIELARLVERMGGVDWRAETERSLRAVRLNGERLGTIRVR